jgi:hypothetical protein
MLINHLPEFMQNVKEISHLMASESEEINFIRSAVGRSLDNSFATFADGSKGGLDRWEKLLGIPHKEGRAIADRRREILVRLSTNSLPYTYNSLNAMLTRLYGADGMSRHFFLFDDKSYTITFYFEAILELSFLEIQRLLRRWIPANIAIEIVFIFRSYRELRQRTHRRLADWTHVQIRKQNIGGEFL